MPKCTNETVGFGKVGRRVANVHVEARNRELVLPRALNAVLELLMPNTVLRLRAARVHFLAVTVTEAGARIVARAGVCTCWGTACAGAGSGNFASSAAIGTSTGAAGDSCGNSETGTSATCFSARRSWMTRVSASLRNPAANWCRSRRISSDAALNALACCSSP